MTRKKKSHQKTRAPNPARGFESHLPFLPGKGDLSLEELDFNEATDGYASLEDRILHRLVLDMELETDLPQSRQRPKPQQASKPAGTGKNQNNKRPRQRQKAKQQKPLNASANASASQAINSAKSYVNCPPPDLVGSKNSQDDEVPSTDTVDQEEDVVVFAGRNQRVVKQKPKDSKRGNQTDLTKVGQLHRTSGRREKKREKAPRDDEDEHDLQAALDLQDTFDVSFYDMKKPGNSKRTSRKATNGDLLMITAMEEASVQFHRSISESNDDPDLLEQRNSASPASDEEEAPAVVSGFFTGLEDNSYGNFDIMDRDRPSIARLSKKTPFPDISDEDMEAALLEGIARDKIKKREKKQHRQSLREQGQFAKGPSQKLKAVYAGGMTFEDLTSEVEAFLRSDQQSLSLPPMAKSDRKVVHILGNAFGLKSKSMGNGNDRFPCLHKTARVQSFNQAKFDVIRNGLSRKFGRQGRDKNREGGSAKAGSISGFSYREGEIVGGSAPEIGNDNRGRAMLEKMGWSSGTALGSLTNKGIMQPVQHVVKKGRAGLG